MPRKQRMDKEIVVYLNIGVELNALKKGIKFAGKWIELKRITLIEVT